MDFSFSGVVSKDTNRRKDIMGINGETSWILAQDVFSKMLHCDTRLSKASPLNWIDEFLTKYKPLDCRRRFIILDQGGELYGNPKVQKIIKKHEYDIMPTGADASFQNPCKRYHQTIGDAIRAVLIGANLDAKFWPYALHVGKSKNPIAEIF